MDRIATLAEISLIEYQTRTNITGNTQWSILRIGHETFQSKVTLDSTRKTVDGENLLGAFILRFNDFLNDKHKKEDTFFYGNRCINLSHQEKYVRMFVMRGVTGVLGLYLSVLFIPYRDKNDIELKDHMVKILTEYRNNRIK